MKRHKIGYRLGVIRRTAACALCYFGIGVMSSAVAQVTFTRITEGEIAESVGLFFNCSWGDYDADGYVDLVVTSNPGSSLLLHNDGNGSFSRVLDSAIEKDSPSTGSIPLWADYDNDGDLDLFVSWMEGFGDMVKLFPAAYTGVEGLLNDRLYRNEGDGTFSKVTEGDWVNDSGDAWGSSSAWADFDNDGHLDLYVGNAHEQQNFLYRNNGDGTMIEVGDGTSVVRGEVETHGVIWTDYNNDRYPDLIVMGQLTRQFRNNGDGTFTPEGLQQDQLFDWGVAAGDYDNDGDMDLAVASWHNNRLYRNDGAGGFVEVMDGVINVEDQFESISPSWADYDNDGYLDLHITNHRGRNNFLYHNEGDGNFTRVTDGSIVNDGGLGWGAAWADYDNDGDLDLVETDGAVWPSVSSTRSLKLYQNDGTTNNWLILSLEGVVSNRSAIGAKVRIKTKVNGVDLDQMREVSSVSGSGSQNDLRVHFGLGDAASVDSLTIEWPSGATQKLSNVAANQILVVEELVDPLIGGLPIGVEDWFHSDWFGYYVTAFAPWLFHAEHGFLYRHPESSNASMFVYDDAMGAWCWTSETVYPFVYAYDPPADNVGTDVEEAWLYYFEGSGAPRVFGVVDGASAGSALFFGP